MWRIALVLLCASTLPAASDRHRPAANKRPARASSWSADAVNNASLKPRIGPRSTGPAVLRAQILLDRAHFSVGEMDGSYGENMRNTVKAYQTAHELPGDGIVNRATWDALNTDTEPAVAPYTITEKEVAGPFEKIPADMLEQAKLTALGYQSETEELGERFHCSPKLLAKLNPGKHFDKVGEQIQAPQVAREPIKGTVAKVVVDEATKSAEAVDAEGKVLTHYPATMGSQHDPLPVGDWKIHRPIHNPDFFYNSDLFWDADAEHAKAKIPPGPNNPVGVVWIGLSKEHYGIHGTPEPSEIGKTQSHGCIRLTNWDAEDLAGLVKPNMTAILKKE